MEWKVIAALGVLALALVAGLAISIVTSVNKYAKRFVREPEDRRRGFDVKTFEVLEAGQSCDARASENAPAKEALQAVLHRDADG